ncbi:MAG: GAF domain-containing SpoIIE family protein phosphatase [Spirochaetota bacterium]
MSEYPNKEEIEQLLLENQRLKQEITSLKSIVKMYENYQSFADKEMIETKSVLSAQDKILEFTMEENNKSKQTLEAMDVTQELARKEMLLKNETLQKILSISKEITKIPQGKGLLDKIMQEVMQLSNANFGALFLVLEEKKLKPKTLVNISKDYFNSQEFQFYKKYLKQCMQDRRIIATKIQNGNDSLSTSVVCAPLIGKKLSGIIFLTLHSDSQTSQFIDLETIELYSAQAAIAIENMYLYQNLEGEVRKRTIELQTSYSRIQELYREIELDLKIARKIQTSFLPKIHRNETRASFDIVYLPTSYIGGDIFDIFYKDENTIRVFLADATGHGIQAALITMLILGEYNRIKNMIGSTDKLAKILNYEFFIKFSHLTGLFSFILLDINFKSRKLNFVSGGHPGQFFIHKQKVIELEKTGRIIGLLDNSTYKTTTLDFSPGDRIFLFTDGIFEETNKDNEIFGELRLKQVVEKHINEPYNLILSHVMKEVYEFTESVGLLDDLTMLFIEL